MALFNGHEHHPALLYIGMDTFDPLVGLSVTIFGIKSLVVAGAGGEDVPVGMITQQFK